MSLASNLKQKSVSTSPSEPDIHLEITRSQGRKRNILAKILIPSSSKRVWQVISDYEAFAEFIPTLTKSKRIDRPTGGIRLEEIRTNSVLGVNFSNRSVFEIEEEPTHSIHYRLVEGDIKELYGVWRLEPIRMSKSQIGIELIFDFVVLPPRIMPVTLVEHMLRQNIPTNMTAIRQRVADLEVEISK